MQSWQLTEIDTPGGSRSPVVLHSDDDSRAVLVTLEAGQELGDHQVHENAWIVVVEGTVRIASGGDAVDAGVGALVRFEENERHTIATDGGARILLLLAPWPGEGHYRADD